MQTGAEDHPFGRSHHLDDAYSANVSRQTICTIISEADEGMTDDRVAEPALSPVYPVIFID